MGIFQSCLVKNNKVGVLKEEKEVYEKVLRTMVTNEVTAKRGGVAFGLTFLSEETRKVPPPRLLEDKKGDFEKWRESQEKTQALKQDRAQQNREEARIQKEIEAAHREMERLEKYVNSCLAKNNKVGVLKEEKEVYEKVLRTMVTNEVTEKKGGVAFGVTFLSEETRKVPPPSLLEDKKGDFEKWRESQEKTQAIKQGRAQQSRAEARIQKEIEAAHKEMERLEKYVNICPE